MRVLLFFPYSCSFSPIDGCLMINFSVSLSCQHSPYFRRKSSSDNCCCQPRVSRHSPSSGLIHQRSCTQSGPIYFQITQLVAWQYVWCASDSIPVSSFVVNSCSSPQSTRTVISTVKLDHILQQHATPPTRTNLHQICSISPAVWNGLGLCSDLFGLPLISAAQQSDFGRSCSTQTSCHIPRFRISLLCQFSPPCHGDAGD